MNTPTPETDHLEKNLGNAAHPVLSSFCRKLERERDEAREDLEFRRALHKLQEEYLVTARRKRDDLQNAINGLCEHFQIHPASITFFAVEILAIERQRNEMAEILRDILAYDKGDKPHDYWTLHNLAQENAMAFDAWQEILRKIEQALETKP